MGFIYGIKYIFQANLPKTYSLTSWLRQQSGICDPSAGSSAPNPGLKCLNPVQDIQIQILDIQIQDLNSQSGLAPPSLINSFRF